VETIATSLKHQSGDPPESNRTRKLRQLGSSLTLPAFVGSSLRPGQRNLLFFTFQAQHADVNWFPVVDIRSPNDVPITCICNPTARSVGSVLVADKLRMCVGSSISGVTHEGEAARCAGATHSVSSCFANSPWSNCIRHLFFDFSGGLRDRFHPCKIQLPL
jgi:hypothetical protein